MSDEIRLPKPDYATSVGVQHHVCEHDGCSKDAGWGFAKPKQASHWFCFEHRGEGEKFL
ncbi:MULTISPECIES: hypothetical protein [unclassified Mesorhizobium]|uniref:hypothetical protein n=1 Tax=unclassified Mesorhizobium TaxID=325217 RepID=UPI0024156F98|nr:MULTISPECIES: hypothetical protein [unclassified Mesorhizobium]MDG4890018.1 hypothetical protein [Mesorhizobium sp. WSM4887]MDG4904160.1 hypothetical protein [Mesorhizobium sp. WSM4962]MDG4909187.1 hypothetical protein [Mesorhizobium sp. WSM4898]MDG4921811.1 hypothetical protein [Mesorhizobium sp. WSM4989]